MPFPSVEASVEDKPVKPTSSLVAAIHKALAKLGTSNGTINPDSTHNVGRLLGAAYTWDAAESYCKGCASDAWAALNAEGIRLAPETLTAGNYVEAESPHFMLTTRVSEPVRRFNAEALAIALLKSRYKVPLHVTKELIAAAKIPTKGTVSSKIVER